MSNQSPYAIGVLNPPPYGPERSITDKQLNVMFNPFMSKEGFMPRAGNREGFVHNHDIMSDDPANRYSYNIQIPQRQCGKN